MLKLRWWLLVVLVAFFPSVVTAQTEVSRSTWWACKMINNAYTPWGDTADANHVSVGNCVELTWSASGAPHGFSSSAFVASSRAETEFAGGNDIGSDYYQTIIPPYNVRSFVLSCVVHAVTTATGSLSAAGASENGIFASGSATVPLTFSRSVTTSNTDTTFSADSASWQWTATTGNAWSGVSVTSQANYFPRVRANTSVGASSVTARTAQSDVTCNVVDWVLMTSGSTLNWSPPDAATNTPTNTPVPTSTPTPTNTPTDTPTNTPVPTSTPTPTNTPTNTPVPTSTPTSTPTPANTPTSTSTEYESLYVQAAISQAQPTTTLNPILPVSPTPTFVIPAAGTPLPGLTPFPGVAWLCWGDTNGVTTGALDHANVCTWGDYLEMILEGQSSEAKPIIYEPLDDNDYLRLMAFAFPDHVTKAAVTCSVRGGTDSHPGMATGGAAVTIHFGSGCTGDCQVEYGAGDEESVGFFGPGQFEYTTAMTFTADTGKVLPGGLPLTGLSLVDYPHITVSGVAQRQRVCQDGADGQPVCFRRDVSFGLLAACEIQRFWIGSDVFTPTKPLVGDVSPRPTLTFSDTWSTPVSWVPAPNWSVNPWVSGTPQPVAIGITPGVTECFTLLPQFSFDAGTVLGFAIGVIGWDAFEICVEPSTLELEFLGINWWAWAVTLLLVGAIGILYSRLR